MQRYLVPLCLAGLIIGMLVATPVAAQEPVVRAVLFWSNSCPHCHAVINQVLPPIQAKYGARFELQMLEVSSQANLERLMGILQDYKVSRSSWVVPFLVIGQVYLVGGDLIAGRLAPEIERGLAAGGVEYPATLRQAMPTPTATPQASDCPTCTEELMRFAGRTPEPVIATPPPLPLGLKGEPATAILAALITLGMIIVLVVVAGLVLRHLLRPPAAPDIAVVRPGWIIVALTLVGLTAAIYLSYVELSHTHAVCGPMSDCDLVQTSSYARFLGMPVAVLGALTYLVILLVWSVSRWLPDRWVPLSAWALLGIAFGGTLFSAYLTFLEPFVIGAVCPWCLTSAVAMTLLLLVSARTALASAR